MPLAKWIPPALRQLAMTETAVPRETTVIFTLDKSSIIKWMCKGLVDNGLLAVSGSGCDPEPLFVYFKAGYLLSSCELRESLACHRASTPLGHSLAPRNLLSTSILRISLLFLGGCDIVKKREVFT